MEEKSSNHRIVDEHMYDMNLKLDEKKVCKISLEKNEKLYMYTREISKK
jgi:hypothetical protein